MDNYFSVRIFGPQEKLKIDMAYQLMCLLTSSLNNVGFLSIFCSKIHAISKALYSLKMKTTLNLRGNSKERVDKEREKKIRETRITHDALFLHLVNLGFRVVEIPLQ